MTSRKTWCDSQVNLRIPIKFRLNQNHRRRLHRCPCRHQSIAGVILARNRRFCFRRLFVMQIYLTCRYNIGTRTKCEDNHAVCTDIIVEFTTDHARLPVSQLTMERFHIKNEYVFNLSISVSYFKVFRCAVGFFSCFVFPCFVFFLSEFLVCKSTSVLFRGVCESAWNPL